MELQFTNCAAISAESNICNTEDQVAKKYVYCSKSGGIEGPITSFESYVDMHRDIVTGFALTILGQEKTKYMGDVHSKWTKS